ncbi:MAG: hypothetical protein E6J66_14980 [Deltaproteobacteria bacterium]|nr:MAG: hypothetical protein E6J66_14980 [Deltaproteobacteria bacterium]
MNDGSAPAEPRSPREIESDIEHLRRRLDRSLAELDRRRHELTDVKLQMRKHPVAFIGAGAVLVLMLGGVGYAVYRSRKRQELPAKAKRLRIAIGRAVDAPEKVARGEPPVWEKIAAAVGTTIAVSLTKKLIDRAWNRP